MTTISMQWDNINARGDLARDGGNILTTDGLESAVLISLFTDRQADPSDVPKDMGLRGFWGDEFAEVEGDKIGSRLWVLLRSAKYTQDFRLKGIGFAQESLKWMIDDGIAESIDVDIFEIKRGRVGIQVGIISPGEIAPGWVKAWEVSSAL